MNATESLPASRHSAPCAHCGENDCAEHCPVTSDGEHRAEVVEVHGYDPNCGCFDVEVVCTECKAEGHISVPLEIETHKDDLEWHSHACTAGDSHAWTAGSRCPPPF